LRSAAPRLGRITTGDGMRSLRTLLTFLAILVAASSCATQRQADGSSSVFSPPTVPPIEGNVARCTIHSATQNLSARIVFRPTARAPASVSRVAAELRVTDYQLELVTGNGQVPVTSESSLLSRTRPAVSLRVPLTDGLPSAFSFAALTLSVGQPRSLHASSLSTLTGMETATPFGRARVLQATAHAGGVFVDLSLSPARLADVFAIAGTARDELRVAGESFPSSGSSLTPAGDSYIEHLRFDGAPVVGGPVALTVVGWSILSLAPVMVDNLAHECA
jgi:hypothetical protein